MIRLVIKVLNGEECTIELPEDTTILTLKQWLFRKLGFPPSHQKLVYKGKPLTDGNTLRSCNIQDGERVNLLYKRPDPTLDVPDQKNSALWDVMVKFLRKHYNQTDSQNIAQEFQKEFQASVAALSLDDLERMASTYMEEEKSAVK